MDPLVIAALIGAAATIIAAIIAKCPFGSKPINPDNREVKPNPIQQKPLGQRPVVHLKVLPEQAQAFLKRIPHKTCQRAIANNWRLDASGNITPKSVDWLYCWGKTGMSSQHAAAVARQVFSDILDISFDKYDAQVKHEDSRQNRYM